MFASTFLNICLHFCLGSVLSIQQRYKEIIVSDLGNPALNAAAAISDSMASKRVNVYPVGSNMPISVARNPDPAVTFDRVSFFFSIPANKIAIGFTFERGLYDHMEEKAFTQDIGKHFPYMCIEELKPYKSIIPLTPLPEKRHLSAWASLQWRINNGPKYVTFIFIARTTQPDFWVVAQTSKNNPPTTWIKEATVVFALPDSLRTSKAARNSQ